MKRLSIYTLEKGWAEWDDLMLHACFQILVDYWEKDHIPYVKALQGESITKIQGPCSPKEAETTDEIVDKLEKLYNWWKITRGQNYKELDKAWAKVPDLNLGEEPLQESKDCFNIHNELIEEDQEKLKELIELRKYLWE